MNLAACYKLIYHHFFFLEFSLKLCTVVHVICKKTKMVKAMQAATVLGMNPKESVNIEISLKMAVHEAGTMRGTPLPLSLSKFNTLNNNPKWLTNLHL